MAWCSWSTRFRRFTASGLDADFVWFPIRDLSFQGGVTVADTRYALTEWSIG